MKELVNLPNDGIKARGFLIGIGNPEELYFRHQDLEVRLDLALNKVLADFGVKNFMTEGTITNHRVPKIKGVIYEIYGGGIIVVENGLITISDEIRFSLKDNRKYDLTFNREKLEKLSRQDSRLKYEFA